jgi:formate dehydrogenase (NADP+) alpha subunit
VSAITLSINHQSISCFPGTTVLTAARENGIKIPTLCHHDDLAPQGACRICLVEDENSGRLMAACVTPVAQGLSLLTHSPEVLRHRRNIVRLMIAEHPESCVVCDKGNRCRLRGIAAELGIGEIGLYPMPNYMPLEQANPFISRDLSKCIMCGKCIRADHELVVVGAIDYNLRGFESRPCTLNNQGLEQSPCTFCGTCLSMCPTGALSPAGSSHVGTPEREALSVCGFCGVGCALSMGVDGNSVVTVNPAAQPDTVNRATLCVRGHFAHDFLNSKERLTQPLIRTEGTLAPATWDAALDRVAETIMAIKHEHGPGSLAFWGSPRCTNEENYLFQKIARALLGTPNIDNSGHFGGRRHWQVIDERTGGGYRNLPFTNLEQADVILAIGADPSQTLPVMSYHIKRAVKKGTTLITAGTGATELDRFATLRIALCPDGHLPFVQGLCAHLLDIGGADIESVERHTEGFDAFRGSIAALDHAALAQAAGVAWDSLAKAAEALKGRRICAIAGHEVIHQPQGLACVDGLLDLLLMTGSIGAPNTGLYVESQENNLIGAWDMGAAPDALPGRERLGDQTARRQWEKHWNCRLSPDPGLNLPQMIEAAEKGRIKALFILGENPLRSLTRTDRLQNALARIDFIVAQDIVRNETVEMAHVVLPGAAFAEKAGSFTSLEGRVQSFEPVVSPAGQSRPDLEILSALAARMAATAHGPSLTEIRGEIRRFIPMYADLPVSGGRAWTQPRAGMRAFHPEGLGAPMAFAPVAAVNPRPAAQTAYPYTAVLAPSRFQAGGGTRTSRSPRIQKVGGEGAIRIAPADCRQLGVQTGDRVRVTSTRGTLERQLVADPDQFSGTIAVPLGFNANDAVRLTAAATLNEETTDGRPELFEFGHACRVKVEKIDT